MDSRVRIDLARKGLGVLEAKGNFSKDCDNLRKNELKNAREEMQEALMKVMSKIFSAKVVIERLPDIDRRNEKQADIEKNPESEDNKENALKDSIKIEAIEETQMCPNCTTLECSGCNHRVDESCPDTTDTADEYSSADNAENVSVALNAKKKNRQSFLQYYQKYCPDCCETQPARVRTSTCKKCDLPWNYECKICGKQLTTYGGIISHMRTKCINKGYYFACFECNYTSVNKYNVNVHLKNAHSIVDSLDRIEKFKSDNVHDDVPAVVLPAFSCTICGRQFGKLSDSLRHLQVCGQTKHKAQYKKLSHGTIGKCVHHCVKCNRTEKSRKVGFFYGKKCQTCKSEFSYKCKECNQIFHSYSGIHGHLEIHHKVHGKDEFKCHECDYKTSLLRYLSKHVRRKHGNETHVCPMCKRKYKTRMACTDHIRYCGNDIEFECDYCSSKFKARTTLQRHIYQKHTDGNEIDCHQCGLTLKNKICLNAHMTYCQKEPQHRCEKCPFKTKYKCELARHQIRIHKNKDEK